MCCDTVSYKTKIVTIFELNMVVRFECVFCTRESEQLAKTQRKSDGNFVQCTGSMRSGALKTRAEHEIQYVYKMSLFHNIDGADRRSGRNIMVLINDQADI